MQAQRFAGTCQTPCRRSTLSSSRQITKVAPIITNLRSQRKAEAPPDNFVTRHSTFIPDYDTPRFRLTHLIRLRQIAEAATTLHVLHHSPDPRTASQPHVDSVVTEAGNWSPKAFGS